MAFALDNRRQPILDNLNLLRAALDGLETSLKADIAALRGELTTLKADMVTVKSDIATLKSDVATLKTDVAALKIEPIAFVFAGTPVPSQTINVPIAYSMSVPANLAGTSYHNGTNPLAASVESVFTLTRITSGGSSTTLGTIRKPGGTASATWSGAGSNALVAGDTLRMTATTVGGSLANVGITIRASRR